MTKIKELHIYTDGACSGNPGPGGWGAVLEIQDCTTQEDQDSNSTNKKLLELFHGVAQTTNNRMELTAAIEALKHETARCAEKIHLFTDSSYVRDGMTSWLAKWQKNGWKSASGDPVKNQDLWQELAYVAQERNISWHWVKGHAGHPMNERADYLARHAITQQIMKENLAGISSTNR